MLAIVVGPPLPAQTGSVVISQIYGGGGNVGAPLRADFVELFNRSTQSVSLAGWTVQYASAAGTTWDRTLLSGTIQPGAYYLVQESVGSVGASTPTPDAVGGTNLSANSAKIALVAGLVNLTGIVPNSPQLVDFVGYGAANSSLGPPAPLIDNVTAILRRGNGCTNLNNNAGDFVIGSPAPRNSKSASNPCSFPLPLPPSVSLGGIVNAASFAPGPIAPGEMLTIFGQGLGPTALQYLELSSDGQTVVNSLSGTRVLFNGLPAPLIYTRADQISAIVPYGVVGAPAVDIQVEYNGILSNRVTAAGASAAPGIFTQDASGSGPGAVQNQDYSLNGPSRPAVVGSVIVIYATGAGPTIPSALDGAVIGEPLPKVQQTVTVKIDGIDSQILYAGMVPQQVNGLLQINAVVPAVSRGGSLPIEVLVGSAPSQAGVTIAVLKP